MTDTSSAPSKPQAYITVSVTLIQPPDCCQSSPAEQTLTVTVEDGGGGEYVVIATDRWALDEGPLSDALLALVRESNSEETPLSAALLAAVTRKDQTHE